MEEKKFVKFKKEEMTIKEYVSRGLGKGRISNVRIDYTPVGEKIIVSTNKPGIVIGTKGEKINSLTRILKLKFKLENPHIEIEEITRQEFDAQLMAEEIALTLERLGNLKFKVIAYKMLKRIMDAGALGAEIRLSGKLPSDRAKSWRFAAGYLKKTGEPSKVVRKAQATALTKLGITGIKVMILAPDAKIHDRVDITPELIEFINRKIEPEKKTEEKK